MQTRDVIAIIVLKSCLNLAAPVQNGKASRHLFCFIVLSRSKCGSICRDRGVLVLLLASRHYSAINLIDGPRDWGDRSNLLNMAPEPDDKNVACWPDMSRLLLQPNCFI